MKNCAAYFIVYMILENIYWTQIFLNDRNHNINYNMDSMK